MGGLGRKGHFGQNAQMVSVGQLAGAGLLTTGDVFFCKDASDNDLLPFRLKLPPGNFFTSIEDALAKVTTGANDYIMIAPLEDNAAWTFASGLSIDDRFVHLVGVGRGFGQPRLSFTGTAGLKIGTASTSSNQTIAIEIGYLKIDCTGTTAIYPLTIGNVSDPQECKDVWLHHGGVFNLACTSYKPDILDYGNDLLVEDSYLGTGLTAQAGHTDVYQQGTGCGAATFKDTVFYTLAAVVGDQFATIVTGAKPVIFRRCMFMNDKTTQAMTEGINAADSDQVFFDNCTMFGATIACTASKGQFAPAATGNAVAAADLYNPMLAVDAAKTVAADTPP